MKLCHLAHLVLLASSTWALSDTEGELPHHRSLRRKKTHTSHHTSLKTGEDYTLTVVHTNDIHARLNQFNDYGIDCREVDIETNKCYGGYARLSTAVKYLRRKYQNMVFFDAGDQFQGTLFYSMYKGSKISELMNEVGYDLMTIGNHEFDDGIPYLTEFFKTLKFPVVNSNMDLSSTRVPLEFRKIVKPYVILKDNVGIIGYITNTTADIAAGAKGITFFDPAPVVQKYVDELTKLGINRIICLSHNGYKEDQDLARRTHGIDLIVGGHSHTLLLNDPTIPKVAGAYPTAVKNTAGEDTFIVQAQCWGKFLGLLHLTFDGDGHVKHINGEPILLDGGIHQNTKMQAKIEKWAEAFQVYKDNVIGQNVRPLSLDYCKEGECALGNLLADSLYFNSLRDIGSIDFALFNSGGIRSGLEDGPVSIADVMTILPFGNLICEFTLTGQEVWDVLASVGGRRNVHTGLLIDANFQVSHLRYTYKAPDQSQIVSVDIWDGFKEVYLPIDLERTYKVAVPDFIALGGDNVLNRIPDNIVNGDPVDVVLARYIGKLGKVNYMLEQRIVGV